MTTFDPFLGTAATGGLAARTTVPAGQSTKVSAQEPPAPLATVHHYDPRDALGPLFHDVQLARVFPDSKTLVDARPRFAPADIAARYAAATQAGPVDLKVFVHDHFEPPSEVG